MPEPSQRWTAVAGLGLFGNALLLVLALVLGFHIEGTPRALADSARGQQVAVVAGPGLVLACGALLGRGRTWSRVLAVVAVLAALVATALYTFG